MRHSHLRSEALMGDMPAVVLGALFVMAIVTTSLAFGSNVQTTLEKG